MKTIPLTRGYVALVDDEDYSRIAAHKWYAHIVDTGHKRVYARRAFRLEDGKRRSVYMHREILGSASGVDHWDTDGLNNQKFNLRPTTQSQNNANSRKRVTPCSSLYKGVFWNKINRKWQCNISIDGVQRYVGLFKDECDAAMAYNLKAVEEYGAFARFNTPHQEMTA